ncbi:hypothetical protein ACHWQZ_G004340 [Mnemiopsis leidyi]
MFKAVLCVFFLVQVIQGDTDTNQAVEDEEDLGLGEKWAITDENLEKTEQEISNFVVFIYVNWCGHCKSFAPSWRKISEKLNNDPSSKTKVFSAEIGDNKNTHNNRHITSFPSIFYIRKGEWTLYSGMRTEENLLTFIKKYEEDPTIDITADELEEYLSVSDVAVVGKFSSEDDKTKFENLSWKMQLPAAAVIDDKTRKDGISVYSNLEGRPHRITLRDLTNWEKVKKFIAKWRRPLVIPFNRDNHEMVFELDDVTMSVLLFHDKDEGYEQRLETLRKVARTYGARHNFVEMEMSNEYVKRFSGFFKLKSEDLPVAYIIDTNKDKKTKGKMSSTKDLSEKGIAQLIVDYREGEIEMIAPDDAGSGGTGGEGQDDLPEDWESRPVKYLTSGNFQDYALSPSYDVFVMIYRDSCPHCQQIKPTWKQLAQKYETHDTIKVAEMKSQHVKNVTGLEIEYVPTLILYPRGVDNIAQGIPYSEKGRTLTDLEKFLEEKIPTKETVEQAELKDEL